MQKERSKIRNMCGNAGVPVSAWSQDLVMGLVANLLDRGDKVAAFHSGDRQGGGRVCVGREEGVGGLGAAVLVPASLALAQHPLRAL